MIPVLLVFLLLSPLLLSGYWLRVLTSTFMYAILASSVNLIAGYAGYPAFGNVVFFGWGAYTTSLFMCRASCSFPLSLIMGSLTCALLAAILGLMILRLRGRYFLIATVGLLEGSRELATIWGSLTGGGRGLVLPVPEGTASEIYAYFYYVMFLTLCLCILTSFFVQKSRIGYALRSIKYDEEAAAMMGINTTIYKSMAWSLSALFTGAAGGIFSYWMSYIEPCVVFDIVTSVKMYLMFNFGGAGTVAGPVLGAFFVEFLSELVWSRFLEIHYLILGCLMVFIAMFLPRGIIGLLSQRPGKS